MNSKQSRFVVVIGDFHLGKNGEKVDERGEFEKILDASGSRMVLDARKGQRWVLKRVGKVAYWVIGEIVGRLGDQFMIGNQPEVMLLTHYGSNRYIEVLEEGWKRVYSDLVLRGGERLNPSRITVVGIGWGQGGKVKLGMKRKILEWCVKKSENPKLVELDVEVEYDDFENLGLLIL